MKTPAADRRVELLFEVGCEEIPAGMLPKAEEELRTNIEKLLTAESLADGVAVETFSTPRPLTAWVRGLPVKQADIETEVTGPPKSVAYDSVGAPTRAAQSFAEKQRVHVSDLYLDRQPRASTWRPNRSSWEELPSRSSVASFLAPCTILPGRVP